MADMGVGHKILGHAVLSGDAEGAAGIDSHPVGVVLLRVDSDDRVFGVRDIHGLSVGPGQGAGQQQRDDQRQRQQRCDALFHSLSFLSLFNSRSLEAPRYSTATTIAVKLS